MKTCPMGQLQIKPLKGPERFADRILFLGYPLRDFIYALEFLLPVNGSLIDMKMAEAADKLRYLLEYVPLAGNWLLKKPSSFLFPSSADENFTVINQMEGIASNGEDFWAIYPEALMTADKGMMVQGG